MVNLDVPATASTSAIPFGATPATPAGGSASGFLLAFVLLAVAFAVLWVIRRRGYGMSLPGDARGGGWVVAQRIRLTPTAQAVVLEDGEERLVVVESRYGVQVTRLGAKDATS
jgi:hypothetical protein